MTEDRDELDRLWAWALANAAASKYLLELATRPRWRPRGRPTKEVAFTAMRDWINDAVVRAKPHDGSARIIIANEAARMAAALLDHPQPSDAENG